MKKSWVRKLICAGLVLTMLVGLTACGKSKDDPNAELAKQYVYSEQPMEMPELGDDMSIRMISQQNDRIYALVQVYHWSEDYSSDNDMKIVSWNMEGGDVQVVDVEMSTAGGSETEDGAVSEDAEEDVPAAENDVNLEMDMSLNDADGDGIMDDMTVMLPSGDYYEYTSLNYATIGSNGKMYAIKDYYKEDYSDPEKIVSVNEISVCCWNLDGSLQWESEVENLQTEESWSYVQNMIAMEDGSLVILINGDKQEKMSVTADGNVSARQSLSDNAMILANANNISVKEDGILSVVYWDDADGYSMKMATYDLQNDVLGESIKLPDSFMMSGYNTLTSGPGADLIYTDSNGVFKFNIGDEMPTQIMSYINSDMTTTSINNLLMVDDTRFVGFYYDNYDNKTKAGIFTKVNPEDIQDKRVIVLGGNYIDYDLKLRVVDFNRNSMKYRVVIKEYQQYSTMDDYMASYTQLNNDILSGSMPDILIADNNVAVENYISKGLVADVGALIKKDDELSQKEFMENVFKAYQVNDKLYYVIPSFNVRTMLAKTAHVGNRDTWTMQDMQNILQGMPEGAQAFGDLTRDSFFYTMMRFCGSDFVDVSTGKCNFNSQDFISMLEYANTLPVEFSEEYWGEDYWMTYESQYRDDKTLLMECYVSNPRDMVRYLNGYFGEEVSYIGFPTESGKGSTLDANQRFVLSAKSNNLDGAWEFVRYYLTDEYQNGLQWELPVNKTAFVNKVNEAMENPYYLDENGQKIEYEDSFYINGEELPLENLNQNQVNQFISFVESVDKQSYFNNDIQNIITEETAAFFEGQKTAQAVADIIQSRVQIYVNENR
ncbi:MAG: extracellular solute-binding protein [Lachnospiraceae bacterium]|nr:extracellular solute-binding protein [Lachnospiraceae bacterium]